MSKFSATIVEDIPAHRLLCLAGGDSPRIRLALSKENPDFVSTETLKSGQTVTVSIKNNPVWVVEAAEDIAGGISVATGDDGKVVHMSNTAVNSETTIGYTLHSVKAGELVQIRRVYKVINSWLEKVNRAVDAGSGGA